MDKISNERKAQIFYQGNGTQTQYSFPFAYLRKAFVHVSLISDEKIEELTQGTDYTVTDRVVTLAAPTGLKIKIYRQTATKPLVGWADASVLRAADMTVQSTQLLHLAEETSDLAQEGGLSKDGADNIWDARYNKIKNLLDPTDPGDAVTLNYITKNQDSLLTQLRNTGAAQNSSIVSTGDSQNARLTSTGDTQNTRLNNTGDTQNKRVTDTGNSYVSTMTTLKDTATTKATEAGNSAELSKKWAMSSSSPDGVSGNKSSKTWAEEAKTSASNSAASANASQTSASASSASATQSSNSASASKSSANASASSASASATSAANAATSAGNAKISETNAANSAKAAAYSAQNAKTWDPTNYTKTINMSKPDNGGNKVLNLLEEIPDYDKNNAHRCGGSFFLYPYVRTGINPNLAFPPTYCAISLPYVQATNAGYTNWSTNSSYIPLVVRNNTTNKVYWGVSMAGNGHTVKLFGAFEHNISVIATLLSASDKDVYDGYTILHKADVITPAKASDIPTKTSQLTNDSGFVTKDDAANTYLAKTDAANTYANKEYVNKALPTVSSGTATRIAGTAGKLVWHQYGHVVVLSLQESIQGLSFYDEWSEKDTFTDVPPPMVSTRGMICIDGQATENYCVVDTNGVVRIANRNVSVGNRLITVLTAVYMTA